MPMSSFEFVEQFKGFVIDERQTCAQGGLYMDIPYPTNPFAEYTGQISDSNRMIDARDWI